MSIVLFATIEDFGKQHLLKGRTTLENPEKEEEIEREERERESTRERKREREREKERKRERGTSSGKSPKKFGTQCSCFTCASSIKQMRSVSAAALRGSISIFVTDQTPEKTSRDEVVGLSDQTFRPDSTDRCAAANTPAEGGDDYGYSAAAGEFS